MIDHNINGLTIENQCVLLSINRSSYYYKAKGISSKDLDIMAAIDQHYTQYPYYGTRRMAELLKLQGYDISRKKLTRYYDIMSIQAIYPKKNISKRNQAHKIYPYLLRDIQVTKINQVWSADITYIKLSQGFVYLVAIIDWHSRDILSYSVSISLDAEFCILALQDALQKYGPPEIFNTDQGVQFTADKFIAILNKHNISISMDGKGRALDNVFIERFWRSLKQEKIYLTMLNTVQDAKQAIHDYINYYNQKRIHQSLGYKTPQFIYFANQKASAVKEKSA